MEANNCDDLKGNSDYKVKSLEAERGQCPGTASHTTLSAKRQQRINPHSPRVQRPKGQGTQLGCYLSQLPPKKNSF